MSLPQLRSPIFGQLFFSKPGAFSSLSLSTLRIKIRSEANTPSRVSKVKASQGIANNLSPSPKKPPKDLFFVNLLCLTIANSVFIAETFQWSDRVGVLFRLLDLDSKKK
jgi:hypothetical protein